jgi:hypothetical protein
MITASYQRIKEAEGIPPPRVDAARQIIWALFAEAVIRGGFGK